MKTASAALLDQARLYDETYRLAASLPPIYLIGPVTQMQQTLMDTKEIVVPACLQVAKIELINSMEQAIRALLAFMAQETDATVTGLLEQSTAHLDNFTTELEAVNKTLVPALKSAEVKAQDAP